MDKEVAMKPIKVEAERACFIPTEPLWNQEVYHCVSPLGKRERGMGGVSIWDKRKLQLEHRAGSPES